MEKSQTATVVICTKFMLARRILLKNPFFDIVCTVHRNQFYKQTNKMHFLYVFILQSFRNSTCFERLFHSTWGVHKFTVAAALYKPCKRV